MNTITCNRKQCSSDKSPCTPAAPSVLHVSAFIIASYIGCKFPTHSFSNDMVLFRKQALALSVELRIVYIMNITVVVFICRVGPKKKRMASSMNLYKMKWAEISFGRLRRAIGHLFVTSYSCFEQLYGQGGTKLVQSYERAICRNSHLLGSLVHIYISHL